MIPWAGGKSKMGEWIMSMAPAETTIYAEAFGGAFWTFLKGDLRNMPNLEEVYYNDWNIMLVNFFSCALDYSKLKKELEKDNPYNESLFKDYRDQVFDIIDNHNSGISKVQVPDYEIARKFIYVQTHIFSGKGITKNGSMVRPNEKEEFNKMVDEDRIDEILDGGGKYRAVQNKLASEKITNRLDLVSGVLNLDFEDVIKQKDSDTSLIYLDPPYYDCEHYYSNHEFGRDDHLRLAEAVKKMKGKFIISYYSFEDLEKWFPRDKYHWEEKEFKKTLGAIKGKKPPIGTEVLIMNYNPKHHRVQMEEW
jgi:DNA adenine methylase